MAEPTPPRSSPPPQPAAPSTPPAAPASRRRGCGCLPFVVAGALAAVAAGGYLLALPTFEFTNELKGPVRLEIGQKVRLVNPGETVRIRLGRTLLVAQWALQRPLSADRQPMGHRGLLRAAHHQCDREQPADRRECGIGRGARLRLCCATRCASRLSRLLPTLPEQHGSGNGPAGTTRNVPRSRSCGASRGMGGGAPIR
jgi:hypothetical protein